MNDERELARIMVRLLPRMARAMKRAAERASGGDLSLAQLRILQGIRDGSRAVGELALDQGVSQPAMSALVERLARDGLIVRDPDPEDRRRQRLALTASGVRLLRRTNERIERAMAASLSSLDEAMRASIAPRLLALDQAFSSDASSANGEGASDGAAKGARPRALGALGGGARTEIATWLSALLCLAFSGRVEAAPSSSVAAAAVLASVPPRAPAKAIAWREAAALALENNPDVSAARRNVESARALRKGSFSPFLPSLAATASAQRSGGAVATGQAFADQNAFSASLSFSQNLFAGFADAARVEQARANEAGAEAALRLARAKALNELAIAFQGLAYAKDASRLSEEIVARREQNLRLVELRFESGRENRGSVLLSQANLEQAKYDLLRAVDAIPAAQTQLRRATGEPDLALDAVGEVPTTPLPIPPPDFDRLADSVPEAEQARRRWASARAEIDVARAGFWPTLSMAASLGRLGDDFFPKQERWTAGLTLTIPLFDGGRDLRRTQSASALASAAEASFFGTVRGLATSLTQAYSAYAQAEQKLKVDRTYVAATGTRAEIARRKYENGLLSFEDWDIIENDLIARQRAFIASKRDRALAERAWRQAISQEETP